MKTYEKYLNEKIEYDFGYRKEKIEKTFKYKGFNVKIAFVYSRFGKMFYGIADTGEPLVDDPTHYKTAEEAEKAIKKFLDSF